MRESSSLWTGTDSEFTRGRFMVDDHKGTGRLLTQVGNGSTENGSTERERASV
jgi:hypothetical protein